MDFDLAEGFHLVLRAVHVFSAILWIGTTWYFTWLDGWFRHAEAAGKSEVWMVHSGGFYVVTRDKAPKALPSSLHWFRFEALVTWLSGLALLAWVFFRSNTMLVPIGADTAGHALRVAASLGTIAAGWFVYDLLFLSRLGRSDGAGALIGAGGFAAAAYGFLGLFNERAAYLQAGALLGTIMALNVWVRIIPAQRRMVRAVAEGVALDPRLGEEAKRRSKHNTFMGIGVVALMLTNHFPTVTYGHPWAFPILILLVVLGGGAAWRLRGR